MTSDRPQTRAPRLPLYTQVLIAAAGGATLGSVFGPDPYLGDLGNAHLGCLGLVVISLLKTLAIPLIFFAILDAFLHTALPLRRAPRLIVICLVNVTVAMAIGLGIMNTWKPGLAWQGHVDELLQLIPEASNQGGAEPASAENPTSSRPDPPEASDASATSGRSGILSLVAGTTVITVVLLAIVLGTTLRQARTRWDPTERGLVRLLARGISGAYRALMRTLDWIIRLVPLAVFGVLAQIVGKSGVGVLSLLWVFLTATMLGLMVHALLYYPMVAWLVGKKPPSVYVGRGADAILTAVSCNSSLATVPITLRCLERMKVSPESSRLAACVGTNLNNDGITLYEAMAALFLAQALGYDLSIIGQLLIVFASVVAGAGVAGIPEAGLVVLPLVLSAAGLPAQVIAAAIPLIMTVDWIIARARSGVNVMSDMLVAILLDVEREPRPGLEARPLPCPAVAVEAKAAPPAE